MLIDCPFCGERDASEFVFRGDASPERPSEPDEAAFADYVYLRANIAGIMQEHWYHAQGCRRWLLVSRNTLNHHIETVGPVGEALQ